MKLLDLINQPFLQRLQAMFASYLGSSLMITDIHGTPLIKPISGVRMCSLVRNTPQGEILCETSDRNGGHETLLSKQTHVYRCLAGFMDFSAAIEFRGEVIGLLVGGQVKTGTEDTDRLQNISLETGVPLSELESAYQEMPCVDEAELYEKLDFIKKDMEYLCDLSSVYYEEHLKDMKAVADANARARMAEDVKKLLDRQLMMISDSMEDNPGFDGTQKTLKEELEDIFRQTGSVREMISDSPEYLSCADKDYRIREVTYELQWVLARAGTPFGDKIHVPERVVETVPPYLCGDPVAISDALNRILLFMTKTWPEESLWLAADARQDAYASLITISVCGPGISASEQELYQIDQALGGGWEQLLETREMEYLDLTTAAAVAGKLSAELSCLYTEEKGLCIEMAVPQLPAKGGFY